MTQHRVINPFLCMNSDCCYFQNLGECLYFSDSSRALTQHKESLDLVLMTFDIACTFYSILGRKGASGA